MRFGHAWVRRHALLHRCVRDCSYLASESFAEHTAFTPFVPPCFATTASCQASSCTSWITPAASPTTIVATISIAATPAHFSTTYLAFASRSSVACGTSPKDSSRPAPISIVSSKLSTDIAPTFATPAIRVHVLSSSQF